MIEQTSLRDGEPSLHCQVEAARPAFFHDVASCRSDRFFWTGCSFAVMMLIGMAAYLAFPDASRDSAKPSRHVEMVAFNPALPALTSRGFRPIASTGLRRVVPPGFRPQKQRQPLSVPRMSVSTAAPKWRHDKSFEDSPEYKDLLHKLRTVSESRQDPLLLPIKAEFDKLVEDYARSLTRKETQKLGKDFAHGTFFDNFFERAYQENYSRILAQLQAEESKPHARPLNVGDTALSPKELSSPEDGIVARLSDVADLSPGELVQRLLGAQVQAVLATVSADGVPATHLMAYGVDDGLQRVFFATKLDTTKAKNMQATSKVSVLWDDRTGTFDSRLNDHRDGMLVTASGTAHLLEPLEAETYENPACELPGCQARKALLGKNPNFEAFLDQPSIALFEVKVSSYAVVVGYGSPIQWDPREIAAVDHDLPE